VSGFDVAVALERIREAVKPFPKATLFALYDEGFMSPFEILVACLISVRTRDEASLVMARRLFARARTPSAMAALEINEIDSLISGAGFHLLIASHISDMARLIV
jgi:endonuclease-3